MKRAVLFLAVICFGGSLFGQYVLLDSTFGNSGIVVTPNTFDIYKTLILKDSSILCAGIKKIETSRYCLLLAKYNTDGTLNTSFGKAGFMQDTIMYENVAYSMIIQPDDKILVQGSYSLVNSGSGSFISRYTPDGKKDESFGNNGAVLFDKLSDGTDFNISSLALLPDNKIITSGNTKSPMNNISFLIRLNTDGSIDSSFGTNGFRFFDDTTFKFVFWNFTVLCDSTIICSGSDQTNDKNPKSAVFMLNPDGSYKTDFAVNGKFLIDVDTTFDILRDPMPLSHESFGKVIYTKDQKILLDGSSYITKYLIRLNSDGSRDSSFGINGISYHHFSGKDMVLDNVERIIIAGNKVFPTDYGEKYNAGYSVARFSQDGIVDSNFNNNKAYIDIDISEGSDYVQCVNVQKDGKILLSGGSKLNGEANFALVRLLPDQKNPPASKIDHEFEAPITIYPNPTTGTITVEMPDVFTGDIAVVDMFGNIVISQKIEGKTTAGIDLSAVASGIYIIRISDGEEVVYRKILKE